MKMQPAVLGLLVALLAILPGLDAAGKTPPKHTSTLGTDVKMAPARLKPGEYLWVPEVSPEGPVVMVVSLPEQKAYVYRNGVLIGASTVSTGKKGHETPTGVFTILQKHEDHYSNIYDSAPMPYMQRLTWSGVALHAGRLPGYPASHGCVRMPYDFAQKLYGATKTGLTVVVSDEEEFSSTVAHPGLVAPVDVAGATVGTLPLASEFLWQPEAAPEGPVTILLTNEDRRISVFRSGVEIGRTTFEVAGPPRKVTLHVLTLLEPSAVGPFDPATGKPVNRWLMVSGEEETIVSADQLLNVIRVPPEFLTRAATVVVPGTTMVITQLAASPATTTTVANDFTVVTAEEPTND
jgi:lipoprotein-anchoring transpeptidase ErfK/SrfK